MAAIAPDVAEGEGGKIYVWTPVTENDVPDAVRIDGGRYTVTVEGDFAGGFSVELELGKTATTTASIDSANLTFTEDGSYNIEVGRCFALPVPSSGTAASVSIYLTPIAGA